MTAIEQEARRKRAFALTTDALHGAMLEDWARAKNALMALHDELGGAGIAFAVQGLCDTLIGRYREVTGTADGQPVRPMWQNADTGKLDANADDVPVESRWAGQLIAARAAMDKPTYDALIAAIGTDGKVVGAHVQALLMSVAITLRKLKAGHDL